MEGWPPMSKARAVAIAAPGRPAGAGGAGGAGGESRAVDRESRRLIREELLTNILVEAGAGSGKTQMLAERMAAGVAAGVYQIEQLAAVTFTRKAASELRGRFHLALEGQLARCQVASSEPTAAEQATRVLHALSNLERCFAGTIHSFCARLLRERPVESGVSPGFTELDEVQDLELRKRAWRDFTSNARSAGDADMMALLEADVRPRDLDSAFATICLNEDVEFPPGDAACPDPKAAWKALERFWKELEKHLPSTIDQTTRCPIQKAALQFRGQLRVARFRLDRPAVIESLLETWDCESKITQYRWATSTADKKRFRDLVNPMHERFHEETVAPYRAQWRQYVYRLSVTLLMRARLGAAQERRRLNALNYGDLLNLTAKVLRENAQVRRALQQKFRHLFVDEFQDTDPVQAEIVFLLAADDSVASPTVSAIAGSVVFSNAETAKPAKQDSRDFSAGSSRAVDWRKVPLRPGALFVVGDPKQSIYRFRRADIDIYNIVRDRFSNPAIGRVLPLTMNFRSVPGLCNWANEVFKTRFPDKPTPHSPRFAALDSKEEGSTSGGVFTLTHTCGYKEVIGQDAGKIATYIRSEVDAKRRTFSDFLILTRKRRDHLVPYARALEALNIPIEVSGAGAFGKSAEVEALTVLLRALSDPQDALSLVAVLRGPLFGISDQELFAFKQAGGWFSVFAGADDASQINVRPDVGRVRLEADRDAGSVRPQPDRDPDRAPVTNALTALHQYWRWTRVLPAAAALDRILDHTGYLALAATTPGGVEAGDLLHAVDRVRQVVEEGGSVADAADALEADCEATTEVESLPLEPGRTDVVRVMNLHKAKGLEAAVVFLADPCGGFEPRVDFHIERTDLKAQGWFKVAKKVEGQSWPGKLLGEPADWPAHEAAERPYLNGEQDRLLYVAATRAKEQLIISRSAGNQKSKAWGVLNDSLAAASELAVPQSAAAVVVTPLDSSSEAQAKAVAARLAAHTRAGEHSWSITSVTAEARHIARMTRTADASADDPTKVVGTDTPAHRADAGMAWGTLIHGLLEHAMRHTSATRDDLRRVAMWLIVEEPQLRAVIDEALDTVERVARADFWQRAQQHERSVETPFVVSEPSNRLTTGVIDLLFQADEGWQVVDYKTDVTLDDKSYEGQLAAYRTALRKVGCNVVDAAVVSVRSKS
jgi:ATP-dependent helicase/nuclease subunit A